VRAALGVLALLAVAAAAEEPPPRGAFERAVQAPGPGRVAVTLDRDVYERARADLGDLRVLDDTGAAVPYLLDRAEGGDAPLREPRILNRAFVRGQSSTVTLDFGAPTLKSELALRTGGDNFRRRVKVEGQDRPGQAWTTLTDGAYVFAVPGPPAARYETVALPQNDFPLLRVTVYDGPDDKEPVAIEAVSARALERPPPREEEVPLELRVVEDARARETQVLADLGARHQPCRGLVLDVADPEFFRGVAVEARQEPLAPGAEPYWMPVGEGSLYRYRAGGTLYEKLRLDLSERQRTLRLRIRNLDDRPLTLRGLRLVRPVERVAFEAQAGRRYRLAYGSERLPAPAYDIARTAGDRAGWFAQAGEGRLLAAVRVVLPEARAPWTERHPALVWAALLTLVGLLGLVTWRTLRNAPS